MIAASSLLFIFLSFEAYAQASLTWTQSNWPEGSFASSSGVTTSSPESVTLEKHIDWCDNSACNNEWLYRKKITFDNTASNLGVEPEALINFPVLVKLSAENIDYTKTQEHGEDIRFTDSDGTDLAYEIESWDKEGESHIWVKVPQINTDPASDHIYLYYGNLETTEHQQINDVWDLGFSGVWHLAGDPQGVQPQMRDSTINNNDATANCWFNGSSCTNEYENNSVQVSGVANGSVTFDGINDFFGVPHNESTDPTEALTIEAWIQPGLDSQFTYYFTKGRDVIANFYGLGLGSGFACGTSGLSRAFFYMKDSAGTHYSAQTCNYIAADSWYHVMGVWDGETMKIYVNGVLNSDNTETVAADFERSDVDTRGPIFGAHRHEAMFPYNGVIDEARLSNVPRSAAWAAATYKSGIDAFNTYHNEETQFVSEGELLSTVFDSGSGSNWGVLSYSVNTPPGTSATVKVRTANSINMSDAVGFTACTAIASGTDVSSNNCVTGGHRYAQYQVVLGTSDGVATPSLEEFSLGYAPVPTPIPTPTPTPTSALPGFVTLSKIGSFSVVNGVYTYYTTTGKNLMFSGTTSPNAQVILTIESDPITCETQSNDVGEWTCTFDDEVPNGYHTLTVSAYYPGSSVISTERYALGVGVGLAETGDPAVVSLVAGAVLLVGGVIVLLKRKVR